MSVEVDERLDLIIQLMGADLRVKVLSRVLESMTDEELKDMRSKIFEVMQIELRTRIPAEIDKRLRLWVEEEARKALAGERWGKTVVTTAREVDKVLAKLTSEESIEKLVNEFAPPKIKAEVSKLVNDKLRVLR